jgi:primosomal protein N' (replication factor Y)
VHASRHDSDGFLAGELERRQALCYPPFSHLIRIVCAAVDSAPARAAANALREHLRLLPEDSGVSVLGPAALFRLRGRERQVLVIKAAERRGAVQAVGEAVRRVAAERNHAGVSFSVDVDPQ